MNASGVIVKSLELFRVSPGSRACTRSHVISAFSGIRWKYYEPGYFFAGGFCSSATSFCAFSSLLWRSVL
jgi:hypothetical protein